MNGIVAIDRVWDTSAIPAAVDVSRPYMLGITIVFSPIGIASVQTVQICNTSGICGKNERIPIPRSGKTRRRRRETE